MSRLLLLLLFLPSAVLGGGDAGDRAREALAFAQALFREGDYYRAITEYKRAAFLAPGTPVAEEAAVGIGLSYRAGQKWEQAIEALRALPDHPQAAFELAETFRMAEDWAAAREGYLSYLRRFPESPDAPKARSALDLCRARLGDPEAPEALRPSEPSKWPALAGAMSAVLPGSGQWYAGRPLGGAATFVLNAALIGGAVESFNTDREFLGSTLALGALVAYATNIYGAVGDAHRANAEAEDRHFDGIGRGMGLGTGALERPASPSLAMVWTVRF